MAARRRADQPGQDDLFSAATTADAIDELGMGAWPDARRFPVNQGGARVRQQVWLDLVQSEQPLLVAGYSSIGEFIDLVADWSAQTHAAGSVRIVLGSEPFQFDRVQFGDPRATFTDEVRRYWLEEHGISIVRSAKIIMALELLKAGRLEVRFIGGTQPLHAKVYVGHDAATVGSSNFTRAGLADQLEANARFPRADDTTRYDELARVATNYWDLGTDWSREFAALLEAMLKVVTWQEALARACAELLEGEWAAKYLGDLTTADGLQLWPSQRIGIAQALWIVDRVGSVLVADATGSGKTRMGAHLVRAVRDRLWSTGRVRTDLTVLVCPPAVQASWDREAITCGLSLQTISHGKLSRAGSSSDEELLMTGAQILAVDEAHHYLNPGSQRTQQVRASQADHVALFTATPINREQSDLLQLVALLGPDNFRDEALEVLQQLQRRRSRGPAPTLLGSEVELLRREIQQFTVRRTKSMLNSLVDRSPNDYVHGVTGKVCRYPEHVPQVYETGESTRDAGTARQVQEVVSELVGVTHLETRIAVPERLRREYSDQQWLDFRLSSIAGLAGHQVLSAMRSSAAAVIEHLVGTDRAVEMFGLDLRRYKQASTGNVIERMRERAAHPPDVELDCELPSWLADPDTWREVCLAEVERYERIFDLVQNLSDNRERAKAGVLSALADEHRLVLAFDQHPVTLAVIAQQLDGTGRKVVIATSTGDTRKKAEMLFARTSTASAIGLCSDALNEGLNLQGASAVVHLDLPTTLRVAEQRIGRVDRMDSPHERIEVWWPNDGPEFATKANEHLARRAADSNELLGSNMPMPREIVRSETVDVRSEMAAAEAFQPEEFDGIQDALEPVRQLVFGRDPLVDERTYHEQHHLSARVLARVSPLSTERPWLFITIGGSHRGAPRWVYLDDELEDPLFDLDEIALALRRQLSVNPPDHPLDPAALDVLARLLNRAERHEVRLLPRRHQRALDQMARICQAWADDANARSDFGRRERWLKIARSASPTVAGPGERADLHQLAERWLRVVAPLLEEQRRTTRQPFVLLKHIETHLRMNPLDIDQIEHELAGIQKPQPLAERVTAAIIGVPAVG